MRIGDLRYRIQIIERVSQKDGKGNKNITWPLVAKLWADLITKSGSESEIGGAIQSKTKYIWKVRSRRDIKASMRVLWQDRTFNIVAVLPWGPDEMQLECEEIGDGGEL